MYIQNAIYKSIPVGSLSLPVAAGTIVTINGNLATSAKNAFGIVPETITNFPPTGRIRVAVAGQIDLTQIKDVDLVSKIEWLRGDFNLVPVEEIALPAMTSQSKNMLLSANPSGTGWVFAYRPDTYIWYANSTNDGDNASQLYSVPAMTSGAKVPKSWWKSASDGKSRPGAGASNLMIVDTHYNGTGHSEYMFPVAVYEESNMVHFVCINSSGTTHTYKTTT